MNIIAVTVTYNPDLSLFRKQLQSLIQQVGSIIVIDNGSTNREGVTLLADEFGAEFRGLHENKGLAFAQNLGVYAAIDSTASHILLLDQDSVLDSGFVTNLHRVYLDNDVGILGPVFYDPATMEYYKGTNYIGPFINSMKIEELTEVTYVIASGSYFSVETFEKVGPMLDELFVDYIDVEWSLRAKSKGIKVCMTNKATMSHTIGDSRISLLGRKISVHSPVRRYFLVRNSFFMIRLPYVPLGYKLREISLNLIRTVVSILNSDQKSLTASTAFKGLKDGVFGRFGPYKK